MTYAYTQDVPIDAAFHQRIADELGDEVPKGLIVHVVTERPDGGLRYLDVWESEQDCERFIEERVHPVVHGLLREVFGDDLPPEPDRTEESFVAVWHP